VRPGRVLRGDGVPDDRRVGRAEFRGIRRLDDGAGIDRVRPQGVPEAGLRQVVARDLPGRGRRARHGHAHVAAHEVGPAVNPARVVRGE
jgi:hypothetical protein